ncbi:hypothetical protein ACFV2Q_31350 [Streptomyces sp. NPDC059650]|uniref:nSTAND1 domain-containing NTPase n=1 Tax=Streptomyces sp. NPDC059650 TaxID=3346896 RepID=UPI0036A099EE
MPGKAAPASSPVAAASNPQVPQPRVTLAFGEACQGDRCAWESRWHAVAAETAASAQGDEPGESSRQGTPYAGPSAFQPEDADRFFGRERLTEEVLAKVRDHRFLAAFGPSGAGKSSVLRAGLVARARASGVPSCCSRRARIPWRSARSTWPPRREGPPARW